MCSECRKQYCLDSCPNAPEATFQVCTDCGEALYGKEVYATSNGNHYCIDCINGMDVDELLRICEISSPFELLIRLENTEGNDNLKTFVFPGGIGMTIEKDE